MRAIRHTASSGTPAASSTATPTPQATANAPTGRATDRVAAPRTPDQPRPAVAAATRWYAPDAPDAKKSSASG